MKILYQLLIISACITCPYLLGRLILGWDNPDEGIGGIISTHLYGIICLVVLVMVIGGIAALCSLV